MSKASLNVEWIRVGLNNRNYRAKDLAHVWGVSESSVSRFLKGEEQPDVPLSRAVQLASMLGISLEDLAKGLGFAGKKFTPEVKPLAPSAMPKIPPNTAKIVVMDNGKMSLTVQKDLDPDVALAVMKLLTGK